VLGPCGERQAGQLGRGKASLGLLLLWSGEKIALILLFFPQLPLAALHMYSPAN